VNHLRKYIKSLIKESVDDIKSIGMRVRIMIAKPASPSLQDVLTDIRGIKNVITVRQVGSLVPAPQKRQFVNLIVGFEDDETITIAYLKNQIMKIDAVDIVSIKTVNGDPWEENV